MRLLPAPLLSTTDLPSSEGRTEPDEVVVCVCAFGFFSNPLLHANPPKRSRRGVGFSWRSRFLFRRQLVPGPPAVQSPVSPTETETRTKPYDEEKGSSAETDDVRVEASSSWR